MTLRPDAQAFDEIRILTVPRWKESELSGSQWRISAVIEFYRNGVKHHEASYRNIETALGFSYGEFHRAIDDGKAYFGACDSGYCDQEGCKEQATVRYHLKKRFCREGHGEEASERDIRQFCDRHVVRGDCGLDDADSNYEDVKP